MGGPANRPIRRSVKPVGPPEPFPIPAEPYVRADGHRAPTGLESATDVTADGILSRTGGPPPDRSPPCSLDEVNTLRPYEAVREVFMRCFLKRRKVILTDGADPPVIGRLRLIAARLGTRSWPTGP